MGEINAGIQTIVNNAQEQSAGISEINTAIIQMDQMTQQNAAMAEETNAASYNLSSEADTLKALSARFRLSEERCWEASNDRTQPDAELMSA